LRNAQNDSVEDALDDNGYEEGIDEEDLEESDSEGDGDHEDVDESDASSDVEDDLEQSDKAFSNAPDENGGEVEVDEEERDNAQMIRIIRKLLPNAEGSQSNLNLSREKAFRQASKTLYGKICAITSIVTAQNATKRDLHAAIINSVSFVQTPVSVP